MGLWNWMEKKSINKCRDNLSRGFPMLVEVCERVDADIKRQGFGNNADITEVNRLYSMLWLNLTNKSLPNDEILAMFNDLTYYDLSETTQLRIQQLHLDFQKDVIQNPDFQTL